MNAKKILVIDDNEYDAAIVKRLLAPRGYEIAVARDGPSGIRLAKAIRPDLILCDVVLPGMGGVSVALQLRVEAVLARVPIIAVTGLNAPGERESLLGVGFDGYVPKPPGPKTLPAQIEKFMMLPVWRGSKAGACGSLPGLVDIAPSIDLCQDTETVPL